MGSDWSLICFLKFLFNPEMVHYVISYHHFIIIFEISCASGHLLRVPLITVISWNRITSRISPRGDL